MKFKKIILLFIAFQFIYSVSNAQIKLVGNITTNGIASYPTHIDSLGKGGYMSMPTIADRDAIPTLRRKYGMLVFVQADGIIYKLNAATLANADWVALALGSSVSADLTGPITSSGNATSVASQTGTGNTFVMNASPTLTGTPNLPTGTIGVTQSVGDNTTALATTAFVAAANSTNANLLGMVTSVGNVATVVTNANLTGPITSSGNTTSVASQTGNGSTFVMNESPNFTGTPSLPTGTIGVTKGVGDNTTALATTAFVKKANLTNADLTGMVTSVGNAATVVTNANLTGVVTSSGNATAIANGAITDAMLANGAVANLSGINTGDQVLPTLSSLGGVVSNGAIIGATKTKVTYDSKGLVTVGADATTADIAESTNKNYVTNAEKTVIGNTSGTNTGDQTSITGNSATVTTNANLTGMVTSVGNAATVVTNANLTGVVTSTGNATAIANGAITNAMLANGAVANLSGTNTGDQTITLTGDVTGSGKGSFASTIANSAVSYAKMQNVSAGKLLGSVNATVAAPGEVTIGSGLSLSTGGTLTASGTGGTVTSVNAVTLGTSGTDITSSVASGTTTPTITLNIPTASTSNRGALSAADFTTFNAKQSALTFGTGLTNSSNTVTINASQNITTLSNLTSNGIVTTSGGTGALAITSILPQANGGTGSSSQNFVDLTTAQIIAGAKTFTASVAGDNSTNPKISGFSVNFNPQTGTTYSLDASDNGKIITLNNSSPITLSLPVLTAGFNCMIIQTGLGTVTLTGLSTTVTNKNLFTKTAGINSVVTIIYLTTNTAITIGDMTN